MSGRPASRGSVTVELTLVVPALVLVLGLLVAGGRLWFARATVVEAAQSAARAASLARSAGTAAVDGRAAGQASLRTAGLVCSSTTVGVQTAAFAVPVGTPATVRTTVGCTVPLGDVVLPGLPGSIQLSGEGAAALDTYRSRR
ncbi:TadE/TadG family type IV pilus assembly protein [Microlunatus capsulatus]|uniref:Flp pilus assembly protein TadG n=1 Tax=Microlunatus capsulatus TaxID=99117 RepID=A0ABS4Z875_9ACTN|nr:TadE/TadG family type IV pilus assembly protein [Microlunatus capsulatus]MBP2417250.1 Flp pilus assembly protein TadG [Microlunatus capsulatus]